MSRPPRTTKPWRRLIARRRRPPNSRRRMMARDGSGSKYKTEQSRSRRVRRKLAIAGLFGIVGFTTACPQPRFFWRHEPRDDRRERRDDQRDRHERKERRPPARGGPAHAAHHDRDARPLPLRRERVDEARSLRAGSRARSPLPAFAPTSATVRLPPPVSRLRIGGRRPLSVAGWGSPEGPQLDEQRGRPPRAPQGVPPIDSPSGVSPTRGAISAVARHRFPRSSTSRRRYSSS